MHFSIIAKHRSVSNAEIRNLSNQLVSFLIQKGQHSPCLAIMARTDPDTVLLMASCFYACIPFVSLNPNQGLETHQKHLENIIPVSMWVVWDPKDANMENIFDISSLLESLNKLPKSELPPYDLTGNAVILSTSGSTGEPKWLGFSHDQLLTAAQGSKEVLHPSMEGAWLLNLPLHHVGGLGILVRSILWDTPIVVDSRKDPESILALIHEFPQIEHVSLVPTQVHRILESGAATELLHLNNILVGAGSLSEPDVLAVNRLNLPIQQSYGMTETFGHITVSPRASESPLESSNCGVPLPGIELAIRSDDSETQAPLGTIWVKGTQVSSGYLGQSPTPGDGWLNTHDIGYVNHEGSLIFVSRAQHIIKSGGLSVPAIKVEDIVREFPLVADAAVLGIIDTEWGERVHACLEIKPDQALDLAAFKAFLKEQLSGNEVPKSISTHAQLPRTALGKIDYPALRILLEDLPLQRL